MRHKLVWMVAILAGFAARAGASSGTVYVMPEQPVPETVVDRLVPVARGGDASTLSRLTCSDAVFLHRAYVDVIGLLPTATEAREFLSDPRPGKRRLLVDRLLERPEFADYWAMKWADVLRVKAEFPVNLWPNAAQAYHRWIYASVRDNKPFDHFARDLLRASGSNFRVGEVNFYRAVQSHDPDALCRSVALVFLGSRAENWPPERRAGMAAFFSRVAYKGTGEWKEEIVYNDPSKGRTPDAPSSGTFPDGTVADLPADRDPREVFADWLTAKDNPWLARVAANRVWYWLMGTGIVHEPDDFRADNPPANEPLLTFLAGQLVAHDYDLRHVYRLILNSRAYQRPPAAEAEATYARYQLRRVEAEVLIDALCQITGTVERYSSAIPEPFTFVPEGYRAVTLPDASITSSFLETFGRPSRDTGLASERNDSVTATQRLHLLNSTHVQRKLEQGPRMQAIVRAKRPAREVVTELYLTILSRFPTEAEVAASLSYARSAGTQREAMVDLAWALINGTEFLYRH